MYSLFLILEKIMIKQISEKQKILNEQYKIVSAEIRADFNSCQCCNKIDNRNGSFCHEIAHIVSRRYKKLFADRSNLLLLCKNCHKNLDSYKSYEIWKINKNLFEYIINYLQYHNEFNKANKLLDSLSLVLEENKKTYDPRIFVSDGNNQRSLLNNNDYHGNVIGQYIYWFKIKFGANNIEEKAIHKSIHEELKKNVLIKFDLNSTTKLSTVNFPEFIAECYNYFAYELNIDIYEYGEKTKKVWYTSQIF